MSKEIELTNPWLVAVWPGMGHVAMTAGYYLMAKLDMHQLAEFSRRDLFDVEHVDVQAGLIRSGALPRSRLFLWNDPQHRHDIVVFIGEAQPPLGKHAFCQQLIQYVRQLGVERVFTFAAMATQMHPEHDSRVFAAATDEQTLAELRRLDLEILENGQISGLNGVLLGVAAEAGLRGACLLGEMPHLFSQFLFPKASLAVLEVFAKMAEIQIDLAELLQQARAMSERLVDILEQVEESLEEQAPTEEETYTQDLLEEPPLGEADEQRIEQLFAQVRQDRSKAYELKRELDRLEAFKDYEDRFLDLFKK